MYGHNNYLSNNSNRSYYNNSSYYNNNSSGNNNNSYGGSYGNSYSSGYNSHGNSYGGNRSSDAIGTYRTQYKFQESPPSLITNIIEIWKSYPPGCIAAREEVLHLSPIEIRIEDYYLIRNKKLSSLHQDKLRDAIRKESFNEELLKTNCYSLLPYSRDHPFTIDAIRALAKKEQNRGYGSSNGYSGSSSYGSGNYGNSNNSYGNYNSYGNSNNSGNNYNSSYNTRSNNIFSNNNTSGNSSSSNNIFNRNSSSSNNIFSSSSNNNTSNNIFSNNNNSGGSSNNIFSRNSNNNSYSSYGNSNNSNIFNSNNNSNGGNNIFNTRSNSGYNNNSNNNSIFNNNNGGASNNIFNNSNNGGNRNIFSNNGGASNNIFNNNNNNGNRNIFGNNNNNGNSLFNNGGSIFNNNNNSNSLFGNNNYNANVDPRFLTDIQTYMKNVNEIVRKLNDSIPTNYTSNTPSQSGSIFTGNQTAPYESLDPFEMSNFIKKKRQEQEIVVSVKNEDQKYTSSNSSRISNMSNNEDPRRSQIMEGSQITRERMRTTFNDHSKIRNSAISNNSISNRGSYIRQNSNKKSQFERKQVASAIYPSNIRGKSQTFEETSFERIQEDRRVEMSRLIHEDSEDCECKMIIRIIWTDADSKKCQHLIEQLQPINLSLTSLQPNSKEWRKQIIQFLKNANSIIRKNAELQIQETQLLGQNNSQKKVYCVKGKIRQNIFNLDRNEYNIHYRNIKKGLAYNLSINNQHGQVSWDLPVEITNLDFETGGEFSIEDNAIICEKQQLNCKCHVTFSSLPKKIKDMALKDGNTAEAKRTLESWVTKKSEGRFELIDIWIDPQADQTSWAMTVNKFLE